VTRLKMYRATSLSPCMPYGTDRDNYTSPYFCNHPVVTAKPTA
jgi:hypothetical protein